MLKVDDPVNIVELTFVLDEVVAEARCLEILLAPLEAHGAAGVERAETGIKFNAIGTEFSVPKLNADVSFGNRGFGFAVCALAVSPNVEVRLCRNNSWSNDVSRRC